MRKGVVRVKRLWVAVCICAALMPRASALSASAAVTMDADTGETLFASNADSRLPMASTTKIMTALVALGEGGLDRVFTALRKKHFSKRKFLGEVAEWSIAAVLKTVVLRGTRGSNPCLSAKSAFLMHSFFYIMP